MGARALAARKSDKRVAGGEQMPRQLAAHVAETDKTDTHELHLLLTENMNLTLFAWGRVRQSGRAAKYKGPASGRAPGAEGLECNPAVP